MIQSPPKAALLLDDVLPEFDETIVENIVVDADPEIVFAAVRNMDFLEISSPLMDAAMFVRALPGRIGRRVRGDEPAPTPAAKLSDLLDGIKVWQPEIEWKPVPAAEFASFSEPGFAKIAAGFSMRSYGKNRTLLTYESRTANTDEESRRRFHRYWWLVRVFVGVVLRAALRTAKDLAERQENAA
jgi:hypothetical protein